MSGIVGLWNLDGLLVDEAELRRFANSLAHRGPDGHGIYIDTEASLGLGHRLLSTMCSPNIEKQPLDDVTGRYWIVLDGEIYNFIEIRKELESLGYRFRTGTPVEVVLVTYVRWGIECQARFNGMWAFAIWDSHERSLFLSRDRFGIKPLYYVSNGRYLAFASELKAFLNLKRFDLKFDAGAIAAMIANRTRIHGMEKTLLSGANRLLAGHYLTLRSGHQPHPLRWWNTLDHLLTVPQDLDQQVEQFRELFYDSCRIRMRSEVPFGVPLSGGLDSGSVLAATSSEELSVSGDSGKAVILSHPGSFRDETKHARAVVRQTGASPIFKPFRMNEVFEFLDDIIFQFEDVSAIPMSPWLLYKTMREHGIVVSLDGYGSDELLAGYRHHVYHAMRDALVPIPRPLRLIELSLIYRGMIPEGLRPSIRRGWYVTRKMWARALRSSNFSVWPSHVGNSPDVLEPKFPRSWKCLRVKPVPFFYPTFETDKRQLWEFDGLNKYLYYDFHYSKLPGVLHVSDVCSMAHGVQTRKPFMDWRLVSFSFSLPQHSKLGNGYSKLVLREAMQGMLPDLVRKRRSKICFINDQSDYFTGPMKAIVQEIVNSQEFLKSEIWDGPKIKRLLEEAYSSNRFGVLFWRCIQTARLMSLFKMKFGRFRLKSQS